MMICDIEEREKSYHPSRVRKTTKQPKTTTNNK